jgi:hypothetical protein
MSRQAPRSRGVGMGPEDAGSGAGGRPAGRERIVQEAGRLRVCKIDGDGGGKGRQNRWSCTESDIGQLTAKALVSPTPPPTILGLQTGILIELNG